MTSCVTQKKQIYFNDVKEDSLYPGPGPIVLDSLTPFVDPKIEKNDVLAVTIQTNSQNESNTPITTSSTGSFNALNGYLVDKNGYIELTLIGFVKVEGLTTTEARELIKQRAKEFWIEPVVNVRIANFDIYVLGDVGRVGTITSTSEKISIVDAIALSGDLQVTARRDNILLIRSEGDIKKFVRFDMRTKNIFKSPYFYLKQRDIIYVEPRRDKIQSSDGTFSRYTTYVTTLVSLISVLFAFRIIR
jgi:polysaccharide export outer membrane protein